jgi:hypothetical protein
VLQISQTIKILVFIAILGVSLSGSPQSPVDEGFCAVELIVTLPDGSAVAKGQADLIDSRGRVVQTTPIVSGRGTFCDFGFGFYSIRVQHEDLLGVTISGVRLVYKTPQHLRITLSLPGRHGDEFRTGKFCLAYLRFTSQGDSVPRVKITDDRGVVREADEFGRVLVRVRLREVTLFSFEKPGYRPRDLALTCDSLYDDIERTVNLGPKDK